MDAWLKDYGNDAVLMHAQCDFTLLDEAMSIRDLRRRLRDGEIRRQNGSDSKTAYLYVANSEGVLCGVLALDSLVHAFDDDSVGSLMVREVFTLKPAENVGQAVTILLLSNLRALPIVDDGRLIGVFSLDYLVDSSKFPKTGQTRDSAIKALREDLTRLLGFDQNAVRQASIGGAYRLRGPWLAVTTLAGVICARLIAANDELFRQFTIVAAFLPLVLAIAESVCHQASSIAIVEHLGARRDWRKLFRALTKEAGVSCLIGLTYGTIVALVYGAFTGDGWVATAVGLSVSLATTVGGIIGLAVTVCIRLCRRNPHVAGGPIALALTDAMAVLIFLKVAYGILL